MSSIVFASGTIVPASWLNDVNSVVYLYTQTDVFTATAGQTVFSLSYTPSALYFTQVFMNGLRLSPTTDYTLVGTLLTLTSAATLADKLLLDYFHA